MGSPPPRDPNKQQIDWIIVGAGPTLVQHLVNSLCLLRYVLGVEKHIYDTCSSHIGVAIGKLGAIFYKMQLSTKPEYHEEQLEDAELRRVTFSYEVICYRQTT